MIDSVLNDIKSTFRSGNMISRIILINIFIFVVVALIKAFDPNSIQSTSFFQTLKNGLAMWSSPAKLIRQPWCVVSHMFLHIGFMHILWNMLLLYWFGRIVGDLLGDKRILPLYLLGGLFGAFVFVLWDQFLPGGSNGLNPALGASAAVMCLIWVAASTAPDYMIRLILIGSVRLKYIALTLLFLDIIRSAGDINAGGHFAHLGGALFGILYVFLLRKGTDLTAGFAFFDKDREPKKRIKKTPRKKLKVVHSPAKGQQSSDTKKPNQQEELDRILDKINEKGYESLTDFFFWPWVPCFTYSEWALCFVLAYFKT